MNLCSNSTTTTCSVFNLKDIKKFVGKKSYLLLKKAKCKLKQMLLQQLIHYSFRFHSLS